MSLHYLAKLEMLIGLVLPLSCYRNSSLISRTETATVNRMGQDGWCCHCGSHSSVQLQLSDTCFVHLLLQ